MLFQRGNQAGPVELGDVVVEAGQTAALDRGRRDHRRERDNRQILKLLIGPDRLCEFKAVHVWHFDIRQDDIEFLSRAQGAKGLLRIRGEHDAISGSLEHRRETLCERQRLAPIYDRLKRNGVRNVQVRAPEPGALDDLAGKMDRVLIDAPCTGTGTWRRRPDTKWKLTEAQLAQRVEQQRALLAEAVRFLKPGGVLVYVTCSLLPDENAGQIRSFLAVQPEFVARDPKALWQQSFPAAVEPVWSDVGLTLTPRTTDTDGFFISLLRRQPRASAK